MRNRQTIAIAGASGSMGAAIAKSIAGANYRLLLIGRNTQKIQELVNHIKMLYPEADVEAMECSVNAGWEADIIISALPFEAEKELAEKIREVANQKIVISIANPLNETYDALVTSSDTSAAEELQKLLPHSKIIKAFNSTFAADFDSPVLEGKRMDSFIAGNDEEALQTVAELVNAAGFNPIKAGVLKVSRTLENMQLLMIQLSMKNNYQWLAGWKILH